MIPVTFHREHLHILHAVLSLDVGGLERLVVGLAREAVGRGHRASVLCIERPGPLAATARAAGIEVVSLDKPPGRRPEYVERAGEALARLAPDVVHSHQIGAAWYVGPAARGQGIPVVHTEHGNHFARTGWIEGLRRLVLYRRAAKNIGRICCVSAEIAASLTRRRVAPAARIGVVQNGVDLDSFADLPTKGAARESLGLPADSLVVGTVGRLAEVKQQDVLLRAAAGLVERFPTLQVLLVGDGAERPRLERLAADLGLTERCVFAGFLGRPELALRAMDVFALTSRSEGFPVSLLEAWAAGVPIVSTAVGGIPDVVTHGQTGLLVRAGDVAGVAGAIGDCLTDAVLRDRLVRTGLETVERDYSLGSVARTYESLYRQFVNSGRRPVRADETLHLAARVR